MSAEWDDLARLAEAIPPEHRDWTYQSWGEQNQNGDHADSILYDGRGETIVYELPNDMGKFIAAANPATILRLIRELQQQRHRTAEFQTIAAGFANRAVAAEDRLAAVEALADEWDKSDETHEWILAADLRAVLSTARTRPTHAQVMEAIALHLGWQPGLIEAADAVLALWADQPTEAEAGARALEQAADTLGTRGRMSPQALRDRVTEVTITELKSGRDAGKLEATARWRRSAGKWRNYAKLKERMAPERAALARFFRAVDAEAQAAPTR